MRGSILRNSLFLVLATTAMLLSSCATLSGSGVGRTKRYTVESERLPSSFDGTRVVFLSDFHYQSKFTHKRLARLVHRIEKLSPDIILLGGDYLSSPCYADELFSAFSSPEFKEKIYAILGNHDYAIVAEIKQAMEQHGINLLRDECIYISNEKDSIAIVGVMNPFTINEKTCSLIGKTADTDFTILLSHTPDFAEDNRSVCDLVLSGHTHGGQVSLFGLYTPVKNTKYGKRFLRGKNSTSNGTSVITTNGVGTSRKKVRFCVPSEIVIITLKRKYNL